MNQYAIVGAKFRPPAQGLLDSLASGTRLFARREASNAYDANAIQVWVRSADLTHDDQLLDEKLAGYGHSAHSVHNEREWHLGYVPRADAQVLAAKWDASGISEREGELTFGATGVPRIQIRGD